MASVEKTKWYCEVCDKYFSSAAALRRHETTLGHKRKLEKQGTEKQKPAPFIQVLETPKLIPSPPVKKEPTVDKKDQQIELLLKAVAALSEKVSDLENRPPSPRVTSPFEMAEIKPKLKYSINQILSRKGTNMSSPDLFWKKFIISAYKYKGKVDVEIHSKYKNLQIAANLIISLFKYTDREKLPILVLDKKQGKIAYYETDDQTFITRADKRSRDNLKNYLEMYLVRSPGQFWYEDILKKMYREMPIELRDKMHYQSIDSNHLSFCDFYCLEGKKCDDVPGAWRETVYTGDTTKVLKRVNSELHKPTGGVFSLDDQQYRDFVEEYYNYIHDHEDFETFKKYKIGQNEDQMMSFYATEQQEAFSNILEDVQDKIFNLCDINDVLN